MRLKNNGFATFFECGFFAAFIILIIFSSNCANASQEPLNLTPEESAWIASHTIMKIGITPDWPPFEFLDEQGNYLGLSADLVRLVAGKLGIQLKIISASDPWNIVLQKLRNGELDAVASVFISENRKDFVNFSLPYVEVPHVVIIRDKGKPFLSLEELNNHRLAYMRGWVCQELLEKDYPQIKLSLNDNLEGMIGQVLLGTADAGLIDLASLSYYSQKHNLSALKVAFKSPYAPRLAFGFPAKDKLSANLFDKVIRTTAPEEIEKIKTKWLRAPDTTSESITKALQGLALIATLALFILLWNLLLRKKVKERTTLLENEIEQNRQQALALEESERKIRAFFNQTLQFIGLLSRDGKLLEANSSSLEMIKTTPEEVIGRNFWDTQWWKHSQELQAKLKNAIEQANNGKTIAFTSTHKDFRGKMRYVDFSLKPYFDKSGTIIYLIAEGRDMTQQYESMVSLKESEERFRLLFESSPDPCWLIQNEKFIECNVATGVLFGFTSKDDFFGLHPAEISPPRQSDGSDSYTAANARMKEAVDNGVARFEWQHRRKDGSLFPVEITLSAVTLNGKMALYCIGRDLTQKHKDEEDRKKLEQQFMQAQKMESIGRLAGGVAHDFNNLLTAIRGFTELILFEPDLPENVRNMLGEIDKAGTSATSLTRQLLAFSRKQMFEPRAININELVLHLQKILTRLVGADVKLKMLLNEELGTCLADPGQIEQVLVNLVVNARDAMPKGGTIIIETANVFFDKSMAEQHDSIKPGEYLMIAVSDNGSGMDENTKKHLFEPFFTTKEQGKGTGLGLATVYGIVKQSGGDILVYSESGHGTTFRIYLPRVAGHAETIIDETIELTKGNGELILVAEDEELLRQLVIQGLPKFGYRVNAFADGKLAIDYLLDHNSEQPAMIITDVVMPNMNGTELVEAVRKISPALPVLFISGYTQDAISTQGILREDIQFITKPFSVTTLAEKIARILLHNTRRD